MAAESDSAPYAGRCWCGNTSLRRLRDDYGCCRECGTVVYTVPYDSRDYEPEEDLETGFYGRSYWHERVPRELGLPTLEERSRSDLTERAVFALERILEVRPERGRLLELGCASGALLHLLKEAGFEIQGLEMSQWVVDFAEAKFQVPVALGTIATLPLAPAWDTIVAIDVLEHLPHPQRSLEACRARLTEDGLLILQTPCYRGEGADWPMLLPAEHLHLLTESSVRRLLEAAGLQVLEISESLFSYDMWILASKQGAPPARQRSTAAPTPTLCALIDARQRIDSLRAEIREIEDDREAKDQLIERISAELAEVRADQGAKDDLIGRISAELAEVRADQATKETLILELARRDEAARRTEADLRLQKRAVESELEETRQELTALRGSPLAWIRSYFNRLVSGRRQ